MKVARAKKVKTTISAEVRFDLNEIKEMMLERIASAGDPIFEDIDQNNLVVKPYLPGGLSENMVLILASEKTTETETDANF